MIRLWVYREQIYPYAVGLMFSAIVWVHSHDIVTWAQAHSIDSQAFFSAIFDIAAILTGFLLAFFGFVVAPGSGFIQRIFGTKTFRLFMRYVAEALLLGAALTLISIPLMVSQALLQAETWWGVALIASWAFLAVSAPLSFWRVARVFLIWIRSRSSALGSLAVVNGDPSRRVA